MSLYIYHVTSSLRVQRIAILWRDVVEIDIQASFQHDSCRFRLAMKTAKHTPKLTRSIWLYTVLMCMNQKNQQLSIEAPTSVAHWHTEWGDDMESQCMHVHAHIHMLCSVCACGYSISFEKFPTSAAT